jgi:hypothetical protein
MIVAMAFRNAKPTTNNHGTIHNHYYGREENEESKLIDDEKILLLAQCLGEVLGTARRDEDKIPRRKNQQLKR